MTTVQIQKEIIHYLQILPKDALTEIVNYVQFIRVRKMGKTTDNINYSLSLNWIEMN